MARRCVIVPMVTVPQDTPRLRVGNVDVPFCGSVSCWSGNCSLGGLSMKRNNAAQGKLQSGNAAVVQNKSLPAADKLALQNLVQLIGEVLDEVAGGANMYITIGANSQRTAFLMTINDNGGKSYAGGPTLLEMAHQATETWLETSPEAR